MYKRILVAIDGGTPAAQGLEEAVRVATDDNARLRLVFVMDLRPMLLSATPMANYDQLLQTWQADAQVILDEAAEATRARGLEVETTVLESSMERISDVIVEEAKRWEADLIVLGTHGRHGVGRMLLGSVAEGVARSAPVPVLLVRGH
jgi:nucleotide-binding universal stress UspA family protein